MASFELILSELKKGNIFAYRRGKWHGECVFLQSRCIYVDGLIDSEALCVVKPGLMKRYPTGYAERWQATQEDILAEDWALSFTSSFSKEKESAYTHSTSSNGK